MLGIIFYILSNFVYIQHEIYGDTNQAHGPINHSQMKPDKLGILFENQSKRRNVQFFKCNFNSVDLVTHK